MTSVVMNYIECSRLCANGTASELLPTTNAFYSLSYKMLDALKDYEMWVIAFSGGKDSTLLLHLVTAYICDRIEAGSTVPQKVIVIYNDTLAELPPVHRWAISTLYAWKEFMAKIGVDVDVHITKPDITSTFYWRVIIRGYPAPTFKFRWCTELLKIVPAKEFFKELNRVSESKRVVLLIGSRDDESTARRRSNNKRARLSRPVGRSFESFLLHTDYPNVVKVAPLRHWEEASVWEFLAETTPPWSNNNNGVDSLDYGELLRLYGVNRELIFEAISRLARSKRRKKNNSNKLPIKARFGCWFCSVSKRHFGFQTLLGYDEYRWLEPLWKLRLLYMLLSDIKAFRVRKSNGYSRLGALIKLARGLIYSSIGGVAQRSPQGKELFYGLFERLETREGPLSLWEVLYQAEPQESIRLIRSLDRSPRAAEVTAKDLEEWRAGAENILMKLEKIINAEGDNSDREKFEHIKSIVRDLDLA